jgi:hypothetical protein
VCGKSSEIGVKNPGNILSQKIRVLAYTATLAETSVMVKLKDMPSTLEIAKKDSTTREEET